MQNRNRPEPGLGRLDGIDTEDPRRPGVPRSPPAPQPRRDRSRAAPRRAGVGAWGWVLLMVLVVAAGTVYLMRDELRSHFPGSQTREQLNAAARAEADGRWHGSADGDDALALYRSVLEADPDNDAARLGLRRVGTQLGRDAEAAIDAGDHDAAARLIDEAATTGEAGERITELRQQLENGRTGGAEMRTLLDAAQSALARRRIRGEQGALAGFKRMLARDPANVVARRGVDAAMQVLVEEAHKEVAAGRIDSARQMAEVVATERPQHAGLPALLQAIAEAGTAAAAEPVQADDREQSERATAAESGAREQAERAAAAERAVREQAERVAAAEKAAAEQAAREQAERTAAAERERVRREMAAALAGADDALRGGRIDEAVSSYRRVLQGDANDASALEGLGLAGRAAVEQAREAIAGSDPERAARLLAAARQANADPATVVRLERELADLNERLAAVLARPELDAAQQAQLDRLLMRARAADARGDLVEPVGDSAYDLYRQALGIDPTRDEARRAIEALPRRAQTLAVHHVELGRLEQATDAVEALQAMAPMDAALPELRRQVASAWLERGSEAVRRGSTADARRALEQARTLLPSHPGIPALARELSGG